MINRINKKLLPMKGHYFLWNAGTGPIVPFLSNFANQLGFSSVTVGVIYTILPICGMIAKPLMGGIADRFRCQKAIFLFAQLLTAAAFVAILYSPSAPAVRTTHFSCDYNYAVFNSLDVNISDGTISKLKKETTPVNCKLDCPIDSSLWDTICEDWNVTNHCNASTHMLNLDASVNLTLTEKLSNIVEFRILNISVNNTVLPQFKCTKLITSNCRTECNNYNLNKALEVNNEDVYKLYEFWLFLILMIFGWVGQAIVVSVGDAICFIMLGDKPEKYGYQRLFGAMGWGIFSTVAGFLIDAMSESNGLKNYTGAFYLGVAFLLVDFAVSSQIQYTQTKISTSIFRDVFVLVCDIRILVFLVCCVSVGLCTGLIWSFLFWLIDYLAKQQDGDAANWTETLKGLVMAIQCLGGEMPFFFLSSWILKRIGHVHALTLVLLAIGIRYVLYSVISNPWWFLPIEFSNGITFGLFYACIASYASIVAPPGTEATVQGMVGAVFEGVGVSLGSLIGGILFDKYGGVLTFRIFGIGALIMCLVHALVQYYLNTKDYDTKYAHPNDTIGRIDDEDDQRELTFIEA